MRHMCSRAAGVAALALATVVLAAAPAGARTRSFVAVNQIQALPAHAQAGQAFRLHGIASNRGARAARGTVTLRLLHRYRTPRVLGRVALRVRAHSTRRFSVAVRVPALSKGSYELAACAPRGIGGNLTCATGAHELQVAAGDAIRGRVAARQAAPAVHDDHTCASGKHSIAPFGDRVYPEGGNGGYKSVHTDTHLIYDAPSNQFLLGTHVDQAILTTQCLTDFSFDFETKDPPNSNSDPTTPGPDMTVGSVEVNGQPASFKFGQPTYPGDPNGDNDPDPLAHRTGQSYPINADNPNPPACASTGPDPALQNLPCPANKLVVTPAAPIPSGTTVTVTIDYTGRPGVHSDGDETTEGWFRSNNPVNDGGFVTTEPMGTEDWMPLNDHPSAKPTYDFHDTVPLGKTAIANGELVSQLANLPDTAFPGGSTTWHWHSPEGISSYLVENSIGSYDLNVRLAASGIQYYEAQDAGIAKNRAAANKAIMDTQESVLTFQSAFNGPYPFTTDGVVIGVPNAGFEEEMQTKITFANETIDLLTLHHENMHQWWGDNVSEANYNLTFFKEGLATLGEYLFVAANAQAAAGGSAAAFEQSLVDTFNLNYAGPDLLWTGAPSDPRPATLFSGSKTYTRPGIAYIALRRILGPPNFDAALQQVQRTFRQGSITEPQLESAFASFLPSQTPSCRTALAQFFTQWWDTVYPPGGGDNRPQITAPGLDGGGFQC